MEHPIPHPLPWPDLDVHADVVRVAGYVELGTGELQHGAVGRILKCFHSGLVSRFYVKMIITL